MNGPAHEDKADMVTAMIASREFLAHTRTSPALALTQPSPESRHISSSFALWVKPNSSSSENEILLFSGVRLATQPDARWLRWAR